MGIALAVFFTFSFSVIIVRLASVALQITGLSENIAKFQALSAFSGSGFTSNETEQVVNFPVRRKIISHLMIVGNLGIVAVFSTLVVGFLKTDGNVETILYQIAWIGLAIFVVWFFLLSKLGERVSRHLIRKALLSFSELGRFPYDTLLQVGEQWSIAEHKITHQLVDLNLPIETLMTTIGPGQLLAIKCQHGSYSLHPEPDHLLLEGESLIILAPNEAHDHIFRMCASNQL